MFRELKKYILQYESRSTITLNEKINQRKIICFRRAFFIEIIFELNSTLKLCQYYQQIFLKQLKREKIKQKKQKFDDDYFKKIRKMRKQEMRMRLKNKRKFNQLMLRSHIFIFIFFASSIVIDY